MIANRSTRFIAVALGLVGWSNTPCDSPGADPP